MSGVEIHQEMPVEMLSGVLPIDKPEGVTSRSLDDKIIAHLVKILGVKRRSAPKVGHAGTLDPFATGVQLIGVGSGTKALHKLEHAKKTYRATICLGWSTPTDDNTFDSSEFATHREDNTPNTPVTRAQTLEFSDQEIINNLKRFIGKSMQTPCTYSAKRVNGKRAYQIAREGFAVSKPSAQIPQEAGNQALFASLHSPALPSLKPVEIEVYSLEVLSIKKDDLGISYSIEIELEVSAGTFIRAIARDFGEAMGVGAHLTALKRLKVGSEYTLDKCYTLDNILQTNSIESFAKLLIKHPNGTALTLGKFDGVHLGHQKLLRETQATAKVRGQTSIALVMDCQIEEQLMPLSRRVDYIKNIINQVEVAHYNDIKNLTFQEFLVSLIEKYNLKTLVMTDDMCFGKNRLGDAESVGKFLQENYPNIELVVVPTLMQDFDNNTSPKEFSDASSKISSSEIRNLIKVSNFPDANRLLGKSYKLQGLVVHGFQRGATLGFRTANLQIAQNDYLIPDDGVYYGSVTWAKERHPAMISVGTNPTFDNTCQTVEVHIPGRDDFDLYDRIVTVGFDEKLRDMIKFADIDRLKAQLTYDAKCTLEMWKARN